MIFEGVLFIVNTDLSAFLNLVRIAVSTWLVDFNHLHVSLGIWFGIAIFTVIDHFVCGLSFRFARAVGNTGVEMAAVGNRYLRALNLLVNLIQQSNSGHSGSKSRQYGVIGGIIF